MLHVHARYIRKLERDGRLRRRLEYLPTDKVIAERRSAGLGLTAPEFATLLAYTKIGLTEELVASDLPADEYLGRELAGYFPHPLRERYADRMPGHPLCREIITSWRGERDGGPVRHHVRFPAQRGNRRIRARPGASLAGRPSGLRYAGVLGIGRGARRPGWRWPLRSRCCSRRRKLTERASRWLLLGRRPPLPIRSTIDFFADGAVTIGSGLPKLLTGRDLPASRSAATPSPPVVCRSNWPNGRPGWSPPTRRSTSWRSPRASGVAWTRSRRSTSTWLTGCR